MNIDYGYIPSQKPSVFCMSKPKYGWTDIYIGDLSSESNYFVERGSYLTDIVMDLLDSMLEFLEHKRSVCFHVDAEGFEYLIVIDFCVIHIIKESEVIDDYEYYSYSYEQQGLICDIFNTINDNFEVWVNWSLYSDDENLRNERKIELREKLKKLNTFRIFK